MARQSIKAAARGATRIVLLQPVKTGGVRHEPGATVALPALLAAQLVAAGAAEHAAAGRGQPATDAEPAP